MVEFPVGPPVDETPARHPGDVTLDGQFGRVERLAMRHAESLWRHLAGHDDVWTYIPAGPFAGEAAFSAWLEKACIGALPILISMLSCARMAMRSASLR